MTTKRFIIFQDYYGDLYIQDKEVYRATGIKVGNEEDVKYKNVSKIVELLNELHEENQALEESNKKLYTEIFEMRTNIALERTEINRETYTAKKSAKEFLDDLEKW